MPQLENLRWVEGKDLFLSQQGSDLNDGNSKKRKKVAFVLLTIEGSQKIRTTTSLLCWHLHTEALSDERLKGVAGTWGLYVLTGKWEGEKGHL